MTTFIFLMVVIVVLCALLIILVLSQNPKGGGLSSTFGGGGTQMMGVQRTNDFLDKATWTLSGTIALLIIISSVMIPRSTTSYDVDTTNSAAPATEQTAPVANPAAQPTTTPEAN